MQIRFHFFLARLIIYKKPQSEIFIHKHQIIIYELLVTALLVSRGSSSKSILFNKMDGCQKFYSSHFQAGYDP